MYVRRLELHKIMKHAPITGVCDAIEDCASDSCRQHILATRNKRHNTHAPFPDHDEINDEEYILIKITT